MKKIALTLLAAALHLSAAAQLFSPESFSGALWGGLIGGVVSGDCRHGFSGEGAAIGAGAGLLAGAILGETRRQDYYCAQPYVCATTPSAGYGYSYSPAPACPLPCFRPQTRQTRSACTAKTNSWLQPAFHQIPDAPRVPDAPTF